MTMMKPFFLLSMAGLSLRETLAFVSSRHGAFAPALRQECVDTTTATTTIATTTTTTTTSLLMAEGEEQEEKSSNNSNGGGGGIYTTLPNEEGSHKELMYALGVNLARQLGDIRPLVETAEELSEVAKGLLDAVVGRLDDGLQRQLLGRRGGDLTALITDRAKKIQRKMEQAGEAMLKDMAATEGAEALPSGVVLHVVDHGPEGPGQGVRPTIGSTVKVHYHGTLTDGTVFDSTLAGPAKGDPVQFALAQVIPGWREGLMKMHEGETAMLGIPPSMAYGDEGTPDGRIPGGSTIFFKVQLVQVVTAGIGGGPSLLGADGQKLNKGNEGTGLLGVDGKPL